MEQLKDVISEIKDNVSQKSINKVDEIKVMKAMLNDPDFSLTVYDKNLGAIGERCPHSEAIQFITNVISTATGLDRKSTRLLADKYEFTKRDSSFLLDNMRDFLRVYTDTGRKINIMQTESTEACLFTCDVPSGMKSVPDRDNPGKNKQVKTNPYTKLVSSTKCPKYNKK